MWHRNDITNHLTLWENSKTKVTGNKFSIQNDWATNNSREESLDDLKMHLHTSCCGVLKLAEKNNITGWVSTAKLFLKSEESGV